MRRPSHHTWARALPVLVLLGASPWARAGEEPEYRTVVRTPALEELRPADDPSGFSTVLRLRDPAPGTGLPQLLDRVPGLRVRQAGPGGRQGLSMRGADGHQVLVLLDGVPLSSPGSGGVDLSLLNPGHLEQVEVRRGGGSTRFGTDAMGGVLILRSPGLRTRARTRAAVGYGSWGTLAARVSRSGALLGGRRPVRYLVSGSYRQSDGDFPYVDENGVERVRANNDSQVGEALLKVDHLLSERWHVGLTDDLALAERGAPGMSERPSATARQRDLRNLTNLQLVRSGLWLPGGSLELGLYHRYTRFRFEEPTPPVVLSANQCFTVGGRGRLSLPLGPGRFDGGVELRGTLFRDPDTDDPERLEGDVWVSSQTWLFARHLLLVPAVRLASATGFGAAVIPRLGLVLAPLRRSSRAWLQALELAANVGRSFRYPSFQEMYSRIDGFGGNPDLAPEDALDLDAGLRWRRQLVSLEAAYYRRWVRNLILFAPVSSFLVRPDNYQGAEASGVEVAAEVRPGLGLELRGAYTLTRTRFGEPAMRLPGHPEHRVATRLGWEHGWNAWRLRLWGAVSLESSMVLGRFDSSEEEGRVLLSSGGSLAWRWLSLSAEGHNLLDKRDALDTVGFPLAPASFLVSLAGKI